MLAEALGTIARARGMTEIAGSSGSDGWCCPRTCDFPEA